MSQPHPIALIVEDEPTLGRQLKSTLEQNGYAVDLSTDGEDGHFLGSTEEYDAVILDAFLGDSSPSHLMTQEAFAAMRAAAQAKDLSEVMKIQGDYLREQGRRSMDQAREIGELIMRFGRDAVQPLKRD